MSFQEIKTIINWVDMLDCGNLQKHSTRTFPLYPLWIVLQQSLAYHSPQSATLVRRIIQSLKRTFPLSPTITWRTELTNWSNTKKPNSFKEAILISGEFLRASNSFLLPLCNSNTGSINRILGLDHRIAGFSDLKMASGQPSIATQMFSDQCSWSITSKTNFTVQICSLRIQLNKFK